MEFTILKDMNLEKRDIIFILFLLIFTTFITIKNIYFNDTIGIFCSDVFLYLVNSLNCIGIHTTTSEMSLSPVICYTTSLFFNLGLIDEISIFIVTGIFAIIGNLGFYILLKKRFTPSLSLLGSILLYSMSLNMVWLATGSLDAPAVGFTIWTVLFFILAVDKNPKYYLISLPLFVISFFTRYTTGLVLPALIVYFLLKHNIYSYIDTIIKDKKLNITKIIKSKEFKYILLGIILSVIAILIFTHYITSFGEDLSFLTRQTNEVNTGLKNATIDNAYTTDTFFYLKDFLTYIFAEKIIINFSSNPILEQTSILSYVIILITSIGLIAKGLTSKTKTKIEEYNNKYLSPFYNSLFIIITLIIIFGFNSLGSAVISLLTTIDILLIYNLVKKYEIKDLNLHLTMLTWFLINFIIFSQLDIKVNRYILTVMPAFIYFFLLSLEFIEEKIDFKVYKDKISLKHIITGILILTCIFMAFNYSETTVVDENLQAPELISTYLINYDSNYTSKEIGVYNKRPYTWFFKKTTWGIDDDNRGYLEENDTIDYYISNKPVTNLTSFHLIKNEGNLYLYGRN